MPEFRRERVVEHGAADTERLRGKVVSSTSGRTRASTGSGPFRISARGPGRTPPRVSSWSVCTRLSSGRAQHRQRAPRGARHGHRLAGRDRQRLRGVECVREPILARALLRRCGGPPPAPSVRRRRLRDVGASHSPAVGRRGAVDLPDDTVPVEARGIEIAGGLARRAIRGGSVGLARGPRVRLSRPRHDRRHREYTVPVRLHLNEWALGGRLDVGAGRRGEQRGERPHRVPVPRAGPAPHPHAAGPACLRPVPRPARWPSTR